MMFRLKPMIPILLVATLLALTGCQTGSDSYNQDDQPYAGWGHLEDR